MLRVTVALLTLVLAGHANAAGWRSLRIDGGSESAFTESVAAFHEKLSAARRHVFDSALQDIWRLGAKNAEAEQREYAASEYFRQLDGLGYQEIVRLTDPSGDTALRRYRAAYYAQRRERFASAPASANASGTPWPAQSHPGGAVRGRSESGDAVARAACGCAFPYPY